MHFAEEHNIPRLLLLIDFENAFDSISWSFLYKVLKFLGFGDSLISWIKLFNNNAMLSVNQGGHLSPFFRIGRGCRQGDPVSPFLFILCVEILGIMIRNNKNINGIIINGKEHKLAQYADDTLFFLDGTSKSLNETLNVLSIFSNFSGLRINYDKTHAVWIGLKTFSTASNKTRWKLCWCKTDWPTGVQLVFSFAPELVGYSVPRDLHRRAAYSICESLFLIHQDVYHELFVCS